MANKKTSPRTRSHRQAKKQRASLVTWGVVAGIALLVALPIIVNAVRSANLPGEHVPNQGHTHIAEGSPTPTYNSNPPTSGPHYGGLARAGSYDYELPDPLLVHNMEDGYVILWYRMGDQDHNEARIRELEAASQGYRRVVVVPRENLDTEYALTAWTRIDKFDDYDPERIRAFLEAFEGIDNHPRGF